MLPRKNFSWTWAPTGVILTLAIVCLLKSSWAVEPRQDVPLNLEGGVGWLNTRGPDSTRRIFAARSWSSSFWTYCCINCHHVLPDLAFLEQKYRNELVVIGIHTPKFRCREGHG